MIRAWPPAPAGLPVQVVQVVQVVRVDRRAGARGLDRVARPAQVLGRLVPGPARALLALSRPRPDPAPCPLPPEELRTRRHRARRGHHRPHFPPRRSALRCRLAQRGRCRCGQRHHRSARRHHRSGRVPRPSVRHPHRQVRCRCAQRTRQSGPQRRLPGSGPSNQRPHHRNDRRRSRRSAPDPQELSRPMPVPWLLPTSPRHCRLRRTCRSRASSPVPRCAAARPWLAGRARQRQPASRARSPQSSRPLLHHVPNQFANHRLEKFSLVISSVGTVAKGTRRRATSARGAERR